MNEFVNWLTITLEKRGWTASELARRAGVVPSTISMVINGYNEPSMEFCVKVAEALNESAIDVLRVAGHLPPLPPAVVAEDEALRLFRQVPAHLRGLALQMLGVFASSPTQVTPEALAGMHPGDIIPLRDWTDHPVVRVMEQFGDELTEQQIELFAQLLASFLDKENSSERERIPAGQERRREY